VVASFQETGRVAAALRFVEALGAPAAPEPAEANLGKTLARLEAERASGRLVVETEHSQGTIYVAEGLVVHVAAAGATGVEALSRIVEEGPRQLSFSAQSWPPVLSVRGVPGTALLEACRPVRDAGPLRSGSSFAGHRILRPLGSGATAFSYLAQSPGGATVVLRLLRDDLPLSARRALLEQARGLCRVDGLSTRVLAVIEEAAIVREHVEGTSLREVLVRGTLAPGRVLALGRDVVRALRALERVGLGHHALHAGNLVLDARRTARLLDPALPPPEAARVGLPPGPGPDLPGLGRLLRAACGPQLEGPVELVLDLLETGVRSLSEAESLLAGSCRLAELEADATRPFLPSFPRTTLA
jgi:hypothetical protein